MEIDRMSNKGIKEEWIEYYVYLEKLKQSGVTNMFGSPQFLREAFDLGRREAINIVANWMENYTELKEKGILRGDE